MTSTHPFDVDTFNPDDLPSGLDPEGTAEHLKKSFTHVVAYHACSGRWLDDIKSEGLIPLTEERLRRVSHEVFDGSGATKLDEAIQRITREYIQDWYNNTIGFFCSAKGSLTTDWLRYPWFIWRLSVYAFDSSREGYEFIQLYEEQSSPTFVKCVFPMEWVCTHTRSTDDVPIVFANCARKSINGGDDLTECLFGVRGTVPQDFVLEYIPAESLRES